MTSKRLWMPAFLCLCAFCQADQETSYPKQPQDDWNEIAEESRPDRTGQERPIRRYESTSMPRATQRGTPKRNLEENWNNRRYESTSMPRGGGRYIPNRRAQPATDSDSDSGNGNE